MGFVTPEEVWMKTVLSPFVRELMSSPRFASRPYWDAYAVAKEYENFLAGTEIYTPEFWRIVCTELWLQEFFDRRS